MCWDLIIATTADSLAEEIYITFLYVGDRPGPQEGANPRLSQCEHCQQNAVRRAYQDELLRVDAEN